MNRVLVLPLALILLGGQGKDTRDKTVGKG